MRAGGEKRVREVEVEEVGGKGKYCTRATYYIHKQICTHVHCSKTVWLLDSLTFLYC